MIFGLMLLAKEAEAKRFQHILGKLTAYNTEEKLELQVCAKSPMLARQLERMDLLDLAVIDVSLPGALDGARMVRKKFGKVEILVLADVTISPMEYMRPSIRASSLLLRPLEKGWETVVKEFYGQMIARNKKEEQAEVLWVENRDGTFRVPYDSIYYVEARDKKLFVRTQFAEYGISGTIEKIAEQLPASFVRCHRSYVVNRDRISRIKLSEHTLYLGEKLFVPVSRSYRGAFKERANV